MKVIESHTSGSRVARVRRVPPVRAIKYRLSVDAAIGMAVRRHVTHVTHWSCHTVLLSTNSLGQKRCPASLHSAGTFTVLAATAANRLIASTVGVTSYASQPSSRMRRVCKVVSGPLATSVRVIANGLTWSAATAAAKVSAENVLRVTWVCDLHSLSSSCATGSEVCWC